MQTLDYNSKRWIRFWWWMLITSIIISLMGCYAPAPIFEDHYFTGGVYVVEKDTVYKDTFK